MKRIFISYRRDDTAPYAGRLHDNLTARYGKDQVFMDIDSIPPGADFVEVLNAKLILSDIMLVVIGKNWLLAKDENGNQRLNSPKDFVRLELSEAIRKNILIIPLLVGGASMPREEHLPSDIVSLARRQAIDISDHRFHVDIGKLVKFIEEEVKNEKGTSTTGKSNVGEPVVMNERNVRNESMLDERPSIYNLEMKYPLETKSGIREKELPFVIGVLADLSGHRIVPLSRLRDSRRKFVHIDPSNFTNVLKGVRPRLLLKVVDPSARHGELEIELEFTCLEDFSPVRIVERVPFLREWLSLSIRLETLPKLLNKRTETMLETILKSSNELAAIRKDVENTGMYAGGVWSRVIETVLSEIDEGERAEMVRSIRELFSYLLDEDLRGSANLSSVVQVIAERIKANLCLCLNAILHHDGFQTLEANWKGLNYLVAKIGDTSRLKVKVLNVSKAELDKDLEMSAEFNQSGLFKKVYEEEFDTFGGEPYSLLIGAYYYGRQPRDISFLERFSDVAAAAFAPFVAGVDHSMFGWESVTELQHHAGGLARIFEGSLYSPWKLFRESENSRYVYLTLPQVRLRAPYDGEYATTFGFKETINKHEEYLWANPAYILAASIVEAFQSYRDSEQGNGAEIPLRFSLSKAVLQEGLHRPILVEMDERHRNELANLGFITLHWETKNSKGVFDSLPSCSFRKMKNWNVSKPTKAGEDLIGLLTRCRLHHYLRVLLREKRGSFGSRREAEQFFNSWLWQYIEKNDGAVELMDIPGRPGAYKVTVNFVPNFQLKRQK
jgi:type VI secretion system protein ImpC